MAYLSSWRLALAADLLVGTDDTVASISRRVGYTSPFTFSDAFAVLRPPSQRAPASERRVTAR